MSLSTEVNIWLSEGMRVCPRAGEQLRVWGGEEAQETRVLIAQGNEGCQLARRMKSKLSRLVR